MPFREGLFWVGITAFGTGLYFVTARLSGDTKVQLPFAIALTVFGMLGVAYSLLQHHYPDRLKRIPLWLLLFVFTWSALGYDIYASHRAPKVVEKIIEKQVPVEKVVQKECPPNVAPTPSTKPTKPQHSKPTVSTSGTDSPAVGSITQAQGSALSFNQKGGITAGTIIGSIPPPARILRPADVTQLIPLLAKHPAKILILYAQHDEEAYGLAKQIGDMLTAAGWKLKQPVTETVTVSFGGPPSYGIEIGYKGDKVPPGEPVPLDINTAPGLLASALLHCFPRDFSAYPGPTAPDDEILLTVMANPAEKQSGLSTPQ